MLQWIRYMKGYVCIRVWGYSPERFMNLCSNHNIFLWDIQNHGNSYTMCISIAGFRQLKPIVKKTGTKVAILKRCGLPFFIRKLKKRKVFLLGLCGSLLFWIWMSGYIWAIDVTGNYSISEDVFMDFLEQNEIRVGMKSGKVDIEGLEKKIRQDFDLVTWTSAKIDGTRLRIQIKENEVDSPGTGQKNDLAQGAVYEFGSDLVAQNDGIIVNMITRSGVPQVGIGAEIKAGDILVSGAVPVYNEDQTIKKYQYCNADADIYCSREITAVEELSLTGEKKEYTGNEKSQYKITVFGRELSFGFGKIPYEHYDSVMSKEQVKLLENLYLPFYYAKTVNREYEPEQYTYQKDEVKKLFSEKLATFMESLEEKGVQIMKKDVTIKKSGKWQMEMKFTIIEKEGQNVPIVPEVTVPSEEEVIP